MILGDASSQCLTAPWFNSTVIVLQWGDLFQFLNYKSNWCLLFRLWICSNAKRSKDQTDEDTHTHTHKIEKQEMLLSSHGTKTPNNYAPCTSLYYAWIIEPLPQRHRTACQLKREHVSKASSALDTLSKQWSQLWLLVSYWELHYLCGNFVRILLIYSSIYRNYSLYVYMSIL